jgi:hypothetical protein
MGIFGKGNKSNYYDDLLNFYNHLSHVHHLHYRQKSGVFQVMARYGPNPWPGIKVHTPLSDEIYNILMDQNFQHMMIYGEIDGIKIYEDHSYKQVTFYISFPLILGYKKLLYFFSKYGIHIEPKLHHDNNGNVLLNRMYIAKDIFVRYSTDFYSDIDKENVPEKIKDSTWRAAEENWKPKIWALSKEYLLDNLYKLNYENHSHIYTFLTLEKYGIEVPIPRVILSLGHNTYGRIILKAYLIDDGRVVYYDPDNKEHTKDIIENPKQALENFLKP